MHPFLYKEMNFNINDRISNIKIWIIILKKVFPYTKKHWISYIKNGFNVKNEFKILQIELKHFKNDC